MTGKSEAIKALYEQFYRKERTLRANNGCEGKRQLMDWVLRQFEDDDRIASEVVDAQEKVA